MRRTREDALQTRENVLKAATAVITRDGVNAFTIEAVAQESGLTKGGVLHHFPSKTALINGLIDAVIETFQHRLEEALAQEPEAQTGRWLRAYIATVFGVQYDVQSLIPALAAAVAADHQVLDRIRQLFYESQNAAIQSSADPLRATIVRLAVDGLVFSRALNIDVLDASMSERVYEELVRMTRA